MVVLAEELSFSKAARRCNVTQPHLSRLIHELEAWVGTPLVVRARGRREVELTPAGQAFVVRARRVLGELSMALEEAQAVSTGRALDLRIGLSNYGRLSPWQDIVNRLLARQPDARLKWHEMQASREHAEQLLAGQLDAAFIAPYGYEGRLAMQEVWQTNLVVLLPADHPLTALTEVPLAALRESLLYPVPPALNLGLFDHINRFTRSVGFEVQPAPSVIGYTNVQDKLHLVALNGWVLLGLPDYLNELPVGVEARPIVNPTVPFAIVLAWDAFNHHPLLRHLIDTARTREVS